MKNVKSIVAMTFIGAPIGDYLYCANFICSKRQQAARLLSRLEGVARIDPQVALLLLRICAGFCKLVHLARTTPPRLASESLLLFDDDVRHCFSFCGVIDIPDEAWKQAQLCLSFGDLGIRSHSLFKYFRIWVLCRSESDASCCSLQLFGAPI